MYTDQVEHCTAIFAAFQLHALYQTAVLKLSFWRNNVSSSMVLWMTPCHYWLFLLQRTKLVRSQSHIASRPHGIHINEPSLRGTGPSRLQDIALSRVSEEGTEPDPSLSVQQSGLSQPQSPGGSESGSETSEDTDPKPSEREDSTSSVSVSSCPHENCRSLLLLDICRMNFLHVDLQSVLSAEP